MFFSIYFILRMIQYLFFTLRYVCKSVLTEKKFFFEKSQKIMIFEQKSPENRTFWRKIWILRKLQRIDILGLNHQIYLLSKYRFFMTSDICITIFYILSESCIKLQFSQILKVTSIQECVCVGEGEKDIDFELLVEIAGFLSISGGFYLTYHTWNTSI